MIMKDLSFYNRKHVRLTDIFGDVFTGLAAYYSVDDCLDETGVAAEGLKIGEELTYRSIIASVEEIEVHGTAELWTKRLTLRRFRPEDADEMYRTFGTDPEMVRYSGWNPYATPGMARETVQRFIDGYADPRVYSWAMEWEDVLIGTIGAYDYADGQIEVGFSVDKACWGQGYATEALEAVLAYLTQNEGIGCVTAWCAAENVGSRRVLEKAGMRLTGTEKGGIAVGDQTYDKLVFEYKSGTGA